MFKKVIELVSNGDYDGAFRVYTYLIRDLDTTSNILNQSLSNQVEIYLHSLCANGEDDEYSVIKTIIRNLHLLEILLKDPIDVEEIYETYLIDELSCVKTDIEYADEDPDFFTPTYRENLKVRKDKLNVVSNAIEDLKDLDQRGNPYVRKLLN